MADDNFISQAVNAYKGVVPNPLVHGLLIGGLAYGGSRLAWDPIVDTIRALARIPGRALGGMSNKEWDEAMDELQRNSKYKRWVPVAIAALAGGAALLPSYRADKEWGGLLDWHPNSKPYQKPRNFDTFANGRQPTKPTKNEDKNTPAAGQSKGGSFYKHADVSFLTDGYVPAVDFSQTINAQNAMNLFTNDPYLQNHPYARNMGTAIVANAAINTGTNNVPMGAVYDSAVDKFGTKLSMSGLASVGVKTVISNAASRLFAGALGAVTGLSPESQQVLTDAGTWAGAITAIFE